MDVATARIVLIGRINEKNVTSMLRPKQMTVGEFATT